MVRATLPVLVALAAIAGCSSSDTSMPAPEDEMKGDFTPMTDGGMPEAPVATPPGDDERLVEVDPTQREAYCRDALGELAGTAFPCPDMGYDIVFPTVEQCVQGFNQLPPDCQKTVADGHACQDVFRENQCSPLTVDACTKDYCAGG